MTPEHKKSPQKLQEIIFMMFGRDLGLWGRVSGTPSVFRTSSVFKCPESVAAVACWDRGVVAVDMCLTAMPSLPHMTQQAI